MSKKKKNRKGTATEAEMQRRKKQSDSVFATQSDDTLILKHPGQLASDYHYKTIEENMAKEPEDDLATSEEYEEKSNEELNRGEAGAANVYATLALAATIREATFIFADLIDPTEDDEVEDD